MKTERNESLPHEEAPAREFPVAQPTFQEEYVLITESETGKTLLGKVVKRKLLTCAFCNFDANTSSEEADMDEVFPLLVTVDDSVANDITSMMERLEKGIAAESEAMDSLLRRLATV